MFQMRKLFTVAIAIASFCIGTRAAAQSSSYCTPSATNCDETINNFTLNTINNSSVFCGTSTTGYTNFTNLSTTVMAGNTYPFSITIGPSYVGDTVYLWIDVNHNFVFDPAELLSVIPITKYASHDTIYNSSLTIPASSLAGNTRLRARVGYIQAVGACGNAAYGEAEDYTVNIILPPCTGTPGAATITNAPISGHICNGTTQTLTAVDGVNFANGISYQWQQSSTGAAGSWTNIPGANALTYTTPALTNLVYYYRIVDSCSNTQLTNASAAYVIPVSPSIIGVQPASTTACAGGGTTFSITPNGSGFTYQWQVNTGSGFTNISNGGIYNGATTTTLTLTNITSAMNGYTYQVLVSGGCLSPVTSNTVTLTLGATAKITNTRPTTFCSGDSTILTTNSGANYIYQWSLNGNLVSGNQTYTATLPGTYSLLVVGNNGCVATDTIHVVVNATPALPIISVNGSSTFCWGNVVPLTSNYGTLTGYIYQWYLNNATIIGAGTSSYSAPDSGTYTLTVTGVNGCINHSTPVHLTAIIIPTPIVSNSGNGTLCSVNTYAHYQWYQNGSVITGADSACYTPTTTGTYYLGASDSNSCTRYSSSYSFTFPPSGVANVAAQGAKVSVYPNPAVGYVNIEAPVAIRATITTMDGRVVMEQENVKGMNICSLAQGMYILRVYSMDNVLMKVDKLVKE